MLKYARMDTHYLLSISDNLKNELLEKGGTEKLAQVLDHGRYFVRVTPLKWLEKSVAKCTKRKRFMPTTKRTQIFETEGFNSQN
jgi:ribonuclease D